MCESLATPAATERDGDRQHPRPLPPWNAVDGANEVSEEVVGIELFADGGEECAGPGETPSARGKLPQFARTELTPPAIRVDLLFGPETGLQVLVDVGDAGSNLAHR